MINQISKYAISHILLVGVLCTLFKWVNAQNVGIGTNTPTGPLSFPSTSGNKIVLWGDGNSPHYGIGVQSTVLQLYANQTNSSIAFGHGRSGAFTERVRIINGTADGMFINGRVHMRNGTNPLDPAFTPGVWLYKPDNSGPLGFMGAQNDKNIGFFGGSGGWGFTYDAINSRVGIGNNNPNAPLAFGPNIGKKITLYPGNLGDAGFGMAANRMQIFSDNPNADVAIGYDASGVFNERFAVKPNGALAVVGNTGQPGQVLVSNGPNAAATWSNGAGGNLFSVTMTQNSEIVIAGGQPKDLPGMVANFSLTVPSRVIFQFRVRVHNQSCGLCGEKRAFVSLVRNISGGTELVTGTTVYMPNGEFTDAISGPITLDLQPGSYSYKLVLEQSIIGTQNIFVSTNGQPRFTWQIFPL